MPDAAAPAADERLIVALDLPSVEEAEAVVAELDGVVRFYKIGLQLQLAGGIELARRLAGAGLKVFLDTKVHDIHDTVRRATESAARLGVDFLTVHAAPRVVAGAAKGRSGGRPRILAVTVLTDLDRDDLVAMGHDGDVAGLVLRRARLAVADGCDGLVCSGEEVAALRREFGPDLVLVVPGIRPAGSASDDQKRIVTPARAIADGATHLVVGRPIVAAADRRAAAEAVQAEIAGALQRR